MSQINITREHPFTLDEAKARLDPLKEKMVEKFGLNAKWDNDCLVFNGRGVNGKILLSPTHVEVDIKLGLLVSALKTKLEEKIHEGLDKAISDQ